jgi:hypothetical protein
MRRLLAGPGAAPADWQAVAVTQTDDAIAGIPLAAPSAGPREIVAAKDSVFTAYPPR